MGGMNINDRMHKKVDSEKLNQYFIDHPDIIKREVCDKAFVHRGEIYSAIKKGVVRITTMNAICDVLSVPKDYFDYVEPAVEDPVKDPKDNSDLRDILEDILVEQKRNTAVLRELLDYWKK